MRSKIVISSAATFHHMVARSIVATVPDPLPVSVVIPAFNRPEMVARAVRSALEQQPRRPAEVIVVDDASSDDTAAAASAAGARVIRHEVNQGEGAARNTAIRAARHDWVALLDSDDEFLPGTSRRCGRIATAT